MTPSDLDSLLIKRCGSSWPGPAISKGDRKQCSGYLLSLDGLSRVNQHVF